MIKLTLEAAKLLIAAAERKSRELGLSEVIAIVDEGTNLIALHRMDNARISAIDIAINNVKKGIIVGGIGVSGGTSAQDIEVANAAVQAFESIHERGGSPIGTVRIGTGNSTYPSPYFIRE
ncbi:heme-binding protein [Paenibacillus melissococcoides]|uniref:Heme-binding protein n=1 Tax=Paenibacillus melissococcoides TaxID=2912268 RepID=A0ABM9G4L2_9BACL|nr:MULTISPECIES: heme-binding protein [Paenibacillus]MEB9897807.1 heme-binding protein [Bacillus cereus]CAH8246666.1 heme-binding protein [Paenibacillus melissococcoides]CAH8715387.1 heme-binding protein [Paenibacillus melissococcoides]CAH8716350.1 heme-binding protein [Paenibacillus melissococcoides]